MKNVILNITSKHSISHNLSLFFCNDRGIPILMADITEVNRGELISSFGRLTVEQQHAIFQEVRRSMWVRELALRFDELTFEQQYVILQEVIRSMVQGPGLIVGQQAAHAA
jgi:hypothetical protein